MAEKGKSGASEVRVCIIGAGSMANKVHYPSLSSFDDVRIVGVCDMDPERLKSTAEKFGIPEQSLYLAKTPFTYREMLEATHPDGVYAIGPPHIMVDVWLWCLQHGHHLYIEKPMGITMHQARMLCHLAEQKSLITQVSHQRRCSPLLVKVREECLKRGPITHAICEFYKCDMKPMYAARDHMLDDCVHSIDTVRWMCGGEVVRVESHCKRVGVPDVNWIGATIHFDNGSTGYVVNSWASGRRVFRVEMHAPGICVDAEVEGVARVHADGDYEGVAYDCREVAGGDSMWEAFGFREKNREFIDSLKTGKDVTSSPFRDCLKTMEVAHTVLARALLDGE